MLRLRWDRLGGLKVAEEAAVPHNEGFQEGFQHEVEIFQVLTLPRVTKIEPLPKPVAGAYQTLRQLSKKVEEQEKHVEPAVALAAVPAPPAFVVTVLDYSNLALKQVPKVVAMTDCG